MIAEDPAPYEANLQPDWTVNSNALKIVEFIGLPASGKTTLFSTFHAAAPNTGRLLMGSKFLREIDPRLYSVGHFRLPPGPELMANAAASPILHGLLLSHALHASGLSMEILTQISRCSRLARALSYLMEKVQQPTTLVLDQGLVQYLGSMTVPSRKGTLPDSRRALLGLVKNRLCGIVHIKCDVDLSVQRLSLRKNGRSRFDPGNSWRTARSAKQLGRDDLARMGQFLDQSADFLELSGVPVLRLSASESPKSNTASLLRWMRGNDFLPPG